jgi:hypothetical protein
MSCGNLLRLAVGTSSAAFDPSPLCGLEAAPERVKKHQKLL